MSQELINKKVQAAFTKAANNYEKLSDFHKQIAWRLLSKAKDVRNTNMVLDVGMGTGFFTEKLSWFLDTSKIVGIDFSLAMIEKAKASGCSIETIQADACRLPFRSNSFDLLVSNLSYQWVDNLTQAFKEAHRVLNGGSKLLTTMFGYNTFKEMFISLENCVSQDYKGKELPIKRLYNHHQVALALKNSGFTNIKIKCEQVKIRFDDLFDLLRWSKGIGANALNKNMYVGKDLLKRSNIFYLRNFRDEMSAYSTFEIIWIEADK